MAVELAYLKGFFQFLLRSKGLVPSNPCNLVEIPRWYAKPRPSVSGQDFQRLLAVCQTVEERLYILLGYACGFRVRELQGIRRCDVDFDLHRITVLGKGRKQRTVPYPSDLTPLMEQQFACRPEWTREPITWFLFPSRQYFHSPRKIHYISDTVKRLGKEAGLRYNLTYHALRYGFAQLGRRSGLRLEDVSFIMGHADLRVTNLIYQRLQTEDVEPDYHNKLVGYLSGLKFGG